MDYNKQTEVNVKFEAGDIYNVSVHSASYSNRITISTRDNDNVNLKFDNQDSLRQFIGMLITAAHNNDWHKEYSSNYSYAADKGITLAELSMWEMSHAEHEANQAQWVADRKAELKATENGG